MPRFAKEAWLQSDDPAQYADAMMRCQNGDPAACSQDGECAFEGDCFQSQHLRCPTCNRTWDGRRQPEPLTGP